MISQGKHEHVSARRNKGVASEQFHTRHSVYERGISTLPSDQGLGTPQGVMLSIGAVKAKRRIYLPLGDSATVATRSWPGTDDAVRLRARGCLA